MRALAARAKHVAEARRDVDAFIEYAMKDSHGKPLKQGRIHREWQKLGDLHNRLMIIGPKLHGKCLAKGTRVHGATGEMTPVEEWRGGRVISLDLSTWKFVTADSPAVISNGVKQVYRLQTSTGRTIRLTANHPVLKFDGWAPVSELKPGDFVAVPREINVTRGAAIGEDDAYLLGYLIGDGCVTNRANFSNVDREIISHVRRIAEERGWQFSNGANACDWRISGKKGAQSGGPTHWLRSVGMLGQNSETKRVPGCVWSSTDEDVACFIAGYFAADGTVNPLRTGTASIASKSRALLSDVQLLLIRLGIACTIRPKLVRYKGTESYHWRLFIRGRDLVRFAELIPVIGTKRDKLREAAAAKGEQGVLRQGGGRLHRVPNEWRNMLRCSQKSLRKRYGFRTDYKNAMTPEKVRRAAELDNNEELLRLANAEVLWDVVESIESDGEVETYDLTVPEHHNFVAEGMVVHNSIQAIARALHKLGNDPNQLIKFVCASDKKAGKRLHAIKENLDDNDDIHRVFPHLNSSRIPLMNKRMICVEREIRAPDPSFEAIGITSAATGDRATGLIADDAVDHRNSVMQPKMRETIREAWGDWYSLLPPGGWLFWISNLWHHLDLTHDLMANPAYAVAWYEINPETFGSLTKYPNGTKLEIDEPLWPEFWGVEELRERKRVLKAREFARLFCLRPMKETEKRVSPAMIRPWRQPPGDDWHRIMVLDLAESQESGADPVGGVMLAVNPSSPVIKVEDAWQGYYPFPEKVKMVRTRKRNHRLRHIGAEQSAGALSLQQHLVRYRIPLIMIPTKGQRKSIWLDEALPFLPFIEFAPWMIAQSAEKGGSNELSEYGDVVAEILNLGSWPTDNIVDALTRGIWLVTELYEVFDGELDPLDDEDGEDPSFATWADDIDPDDIDAMPDDPDCRVLLI
ncbi:MAG: hypothetical protein GTO41_27795 [Burkholderiales bacterium]|nr:hypothetical protein [Burkholderiales bacterium]